MLRYMCWAEAWCGEEDAVEIRAFDDADAAERYVDRNHAENDYPDEVKVSVRDPRKETVVKFIVTAVQETTFDSREVTE